MIICFPRSRFLREVNCGTGCNARNADAMPATDDAVATQGVYWADSGLLELDA